MIKSYSFFSHQLNKDKFNFIKDYAAQIRDYKNIISIYYYNNLLKNKLSLSQLDKQCREAYFSFKGTIYQQAGREVFIRYKTFKKQITKPIEFKSLTFTDINQINGDKYSHMIELSSLKLTNAIINLNIPKKGLIVIPTRYSKKYHGELSTFNYSLNKKQIRVVYKCIILNDKLKFSFSKETENITLVDNNFEDLVGVDTNSKNNLFTTSNNIIIDYDRKLVKKLIYHKKLNDRIQSTKAKRNLDTKYSKNQLRLNLKNRRRAIFHVESKLVELFKKTKSKYLVFEWLIKSNGGNHTLFKIDGYEINYNDLFSMLKLFDIKNIARRIANKHDISVSFIHPEYTSQECSNCEYIDKENRKIQETFSCVKCNHTLNADYNASINIKNRLLKYRDKLNILVSGTSNVYDIKRMYHRQIREVIIN